jgi:hypothetical protein
MNDFARGGRGLSQGAAQVCGSVTRSPDSQRFALRAGRGGPTPPQT